MRVRVAGVLAAFVLAASAGRALAQDDCRQLVEQAKRAYIEGTFDRVLSLTSGCVANPATSEDANALRARTFTVLDQMDQAEQAVTALLGINPQFSPASDDGRRFAALVAQVKRDIARSATSSVSKMNETLLEAPATVVIVTADDIRRRGYLDLEAVLHDLPGFDISRTNGQNYSNIYQRGYRSDSTNRTLFIVDGVEQNDLYSNIAYISRQYPLSNIDRVEVVYGPASTMYGANAFLGVINVITKEPEDFIEEGKRVGADVQVGGGAWSARYVDASVAGRFRDAAFSLTGRAYESDEWDLSKFSAWTYDPARFSTPAARAQYTDTLFFPSPSEITRAIRLDQGVLTQSLGGAPLSYSDTTKDWMFSGKLKVSNFLVGFETWRRREGAAGASTALREPGAANGNIWVPYQTAAYVRYNAALSGNVTLTYFGQAKLHGLGRGSASFTLNNYLDGPLNFFDLDDDVKPFWSETLVRQSSNQFRNELNVIYRFKDTFDLVGGVDLRNALIQSDYAKSTNCPLPPQAFRGFSPANAADLVRKVEDEDEFFYPFLDRMYEVIFASFGDLPRCSYTGGPPSPVSTGGEHFAVRDTGLFAQGSYTPIPPLKLIAGVRVDNEGIDPTGGFGTVATPRLGAVLTFRGFVFKTIYSEAFKDASSLERFSAIPGIQDGNALLEPERARNIEMSGGRQWAGFSADLSVYRAAYRNLISLKKRNLADNPTLLDAAKRAADDIDGLFSDDPTDVVNARADLLQLLSGLSPKDFDYFLNAPLVTAQYTNTGALTVWGVQASATGRVRGVDLFGNYTVSSPYNVVPTNQFGDRLAGVNRLRVGDIATHHLNFGAANRWRKFDGGFRINYTGARPTGGATTVQENLLSKVDGYVIANAAIAYDVRPGLTAQFLVNNVFDAQYNDPGVGTADGVRFASNVPQPGRSLFVRLLTRF